MEDLKDQNHIEELERTGAIDSAAQLANDEEHNLTVREAFRRYPSAVFWAICMSLTIVMEGYDTILIGSLMAYPSFVAKYGIYYPELGTHLIPGSYQVALGNGSSAGAVIGLLINGYVTEKYGHRKVIMVGLVAMVGTIFIPFFSSSIQVLLVGQVLCGIPWGIFAIMGSSYASEVCPLALRGYLTSFVNICWIIGQFIAAGVLQGLVNNTTKWSYKVPFAVQWVWPIPLFILALLAPDSPWWLIRKGRVSDAEKSIKRLSKLSSDEVDLKIAMMIHTNNLEKALKTETGYFDCFRSTNLRRTEIACMVLSAQVLSGEAFAYTSTYFMTQAGLKASDAYKMNFGASAVAFVATCCSWVLMGYLGRRTMIIGGMTLMTCALLVIGILAYPAPHNNGATWGQAVLTVVWLGLYSLTLGPQSFALAAEISATRVRAQTISVARNSYNVMNIICSTVEPYLINPTEANLKGKTGFVWFGISVLTILWAVFRLPETKDLTYEELDILFEKKVPAWKFKSTAIDLIHETEQVRANTEGKGLDL